MKTLHFTISGIIELDQDIDPKYNHAYEIKIKEKLQNSRLLDHIEHMDLDWSGSSLVTDVVVDIPKEESILKEERKIILLFADKLKEYGLTFELDINIPAIVSISGYQKNPDEPMVDVTFSCYSKLYEISMACYKANGARISVKRPNAEYFDYDKFARKIRDYYANNGLI